MSMAILDAIGYVDDGLIDEAERELPDVPGYGRRWITGMVCAAICLVSVLAWQIVSSYKRELPSESTVMAAAELWVPEETLPKNAEQSKSARREETGLMDQAEHTVLYARSLTLQIEEENEGVIVGIVTEVNGLGEVRVGDRVRVALKAEEKAYRNYFITSEPILSVTEKEGVRYLTLLAYEMDLMEECVTVLAKKEDAE